MVQRQTSVSASTWLGDVSQLAQQNGFSVTRWGNAHGYPLLGFQRTAASPAPRIYLSAGIHGDEPAGPAAIEQLHRQNLLSDQIHWTVCPLLNPAGWEAGTRETSDGIDLNRDYRAFRSLEAAAHRQWIDQLGPHDLYLSLHEDWETTGFYLYEINTSSLAPMGRRILDIVKNTFPIEPLRCIDLHDVAECGYIIHSPEPDEPLNWPEAIYHLKSYPHLSYTFETPSSAEFSQRVAAQMVAVETAVAQFLQLFPR